MNSGAVDLAGKVALVTGASSGLGRHFAHTLSAAGASVVAAARRLDRLESLAMEIAALGGKCIPMSLDVTDVEQITMVVGSCRSALGPIDILVNNAAATDLQLAHEMTIEVADAVIATNLRGPWFLSCEVAKHLIAAERPGRIVNISSIAAFRYEGIGAALYAATKAGLNRMTETLAVEWARFGINVNSIAPGGFTTEILERRLARDAGTSVGDLTASFPRGRMGEPSQLETTLLYLLAPGSDFVTGTVIKVDDCQQLR
jgi:NAD(P)-dependent dehydrogenase (short-subunit alcohol dehydrogenase family)